MSGIWLLIHSQTSTVQALKFGNWYAISSHTGMDKQFHPTLYNVCNYLSMPGLKLNQKEARWQYSYGWRETSLNIVSLHWTNMWIFILIFHLTHGVMVNDISSDNLYNPLYDRSLIYEDGFLNVDALAKLVEMQLVIQYTIIIYTCHVYEYIQTLNAMNANIIYENLSLRFPLIRAWISHWISFREHAFNSLRPSDAYMRR